MADERGAVDLGADPALPSPMQAMRLLLESATLDDARAAVAGDLALGPGERAALLAQLTPEAFAAVHGVAAAVDHTAEGVSAQEALARTAAAFDRAAAVSPEGSVALYSLGDPVRLAAATAEVVEWLRTEALLGRDRRVLEVGCGIGRFLTALAAEVELAIGLDLSAGMAAEAGRRLAGLPRALAARSSGRDLACIADRSVDLVLFADSFPYLVQAGHGLPERHLSESARVLRPGGRVVVLNWSYRGDADQDRAEAELLGGAAGLRLAAEPLRPFRLWDALVVTFSSPADPGEVRDNGTNV